MTAWDACRRGVADGVTAAVGVGVAEGVTVGVSVGAAVGVGVTPAGAAEATPLIRMKAATASASPVSRFKLIRADELTLFSGKCEEGEVGGMCMMESSG